jgi:hypothetical protein
VRCEVPMSREGERETGGGDGELDLNKCIRCK